MKPFAMLAGTVVGGVALIAGIGTIAGAVRGPAPAATPTVVVVRTAAPVALAATAPPAPATTEPQPTVAPTTPPTTPPEPTQATFERVVVTGAGADGVNLRAEPNSTAARVKGLTDGAALQIVGADRQGGGRNWRNVKDGDGAVGWVAADFLAAANAPPAPVAEKPSVPAPTATQPAPTLASKPTNAPAPVAPAAPAATAAPKVVPPTAPASKPTANCHPSYPDFCIPSPPPDVNCSSAVIGGRKNFRVTGPDVHRLDTGGRPGIACES